MNKRDLSLSAYCTEILDHTEAHLWPTGCITIARVETSSKDGGIVSGFATDVDGGDVGGQLRGALTVIRSGNLQLALESTLFEGARDDLLSRLGRTLGNVASVYWDQEGLTILSTADRRGRVRQYALGEPQRRYPLPIQVSTLLDRFAAGGISDIVSAMAAGLSFARCRDGDLAGPGSLELETRPYSSLPSSLPLESQSHNRLENAWPALAEAILASDSSRQRSVAFLAARQATEAAQVDQDPTVSRALNASATDDVVLKLRLNVREWQKAALDAEVSASELPTATVQFALRRAWAGEALLYAISHPMPSGALGATYCALHSSLPRSAFIRSVEELVR